MDVGRGKTWVREGVVDGTGEVGEGTLGCEDFARGGVDCGEGDTACVCGGGEQHEWIISTVPP